ncbi:serpin B13 isoform X1 [Trichechus manatus latirostris]|uniref:Serpin B13 n=1 Tax=Trichechus manatus latirostris TaxID=127582 RepID=A0A2Y9DQR3_TRIMA|nr:serpin B13 isoform X1 [Trichechus manatus latirostris]
MNSLGAASTRFGFELFKKLKKTEDGNAFFSPVGISTAIGMILLGAQGNTARQLQKVFYSEKDTESSREKAEEKEVTEKTEEIHHQFQKFLTEINKPTSDYELSIANRLFGEKTYLFFQKYLDYVEKYYLATLEPVDFLNAADESRKKINSWVERQTNGKIKDLFPDGSLDSSSKLVLVNTVYFKGQWDREFKKEDTREEQFWLNKTTSKPVQMMKQRHSFNFTYLEGLQAKILGIPYKNNDLSMFLLLPDDIDGLEKIIDRITPELLIEWTSPGHMEEKNVSVHLPRFQVEKTYNLKDALGAMGITDAFRENQADFSGMSAGSRLYIKEFRHKSFVVVTEEGTEAAAATGGTMGITSIPNYENFHCNHPFLFFIRHNESNSILFFGQVSSP